jgi:hypothetical protein
MAVKALPVSAGGGGCGKSACDLDTISHLRHAVMQRYIVCMYGRSKTIRLSDLKHNTFSPEKGSLIQNYTAAPVTSVDEEKEKHTVANE